MTEPTGMGGDLPDETSADETSADETSADERAWAGRVDWPTGPAALTDPLLCPACFAPLVGPVCRRCGLDTGNPAAARLAAVSREAAAALDARLGLIGRIRADSARAAAAVALPVPAPADVATDAPADVTRAGRTPAPTEQAPPPATPRPSRAWNVQVILLTIGVSALSVGAIFFLVYAFINFGIVWRSVIIVAITIAAIGASSILARRRLRSTAEGVAAFGVVLVLLDAFAARANDLAGLASIDGPAFWGGTLVLAAAGFALWQRVSGLRIPGVAAVIAFAPGVGLLVFSATDGAPDSWRAWATLLAIATAGLVHPLVPASGTPERAILLGMAVVGLIPALVIAPFVEFSGREQAPSDVVAALVAVGALVGVAAVSAAHLAALRAAPGLPSLFFSAILGLSLGVTGVAAALHADSVQVSLLAPAVAATVVALALESASGRLRMLLIAAAAAAVAAAVCVLVPLTAAVNVAVSTAATPLTAPWSGELDTVLVQRSAESVAAVAALTAIVAVSALAWGHRAFRGDRRRARALAWAGAVLLLLAAPLLETVGAVVVGWFALAATAWFGIHRVRATGAVYRPALVMLLAGAAAAGWATGWASSTTWGAATTFTIALLLSVRILLPGSVEHRRAAPRAALLGTAALLGIQAIGLAVGRLASSPGAGFGQVVFSADAVRTSAIAAAILLLLAAFAGRVTLGDGARLGPPDRSTLFWISLILAGGGAWAVRVRSLSSTEAVGLLVLTVLLGVGLLAWVGRPRGFLIERMSASLLLAPVLWLLVDTIARLAGATGYLLAVVPVTAAVLTAAGSLAAELVRPASSARLPRGFRDAGAGLVAFVAIGASIATFGEAEFDATWLVLLLAAIVALLCAVTSAGLVSSRTPRRWIGWVALALATSGLWRRLDDDRVEAVEPWVLPLSGALLLIALMVWRANRESRAAPLIALASLLTSILPVAAVGFAGGPERSLAIGAASVVLLLAGTLPLAAGRLRPFADAAALAGAIGVIVAGIGRAAAQWLGGDSSFAVDAWLVATLLVLVIAGFGLARDRSDSFSGQRMSAAELIASVALTALLVISGALVAAPSSGPPSAPADTGSIRAIGLCALFCALYLLGFLLDRAPFTRRITWLALGFAVVSLLVGATSGELDPIELGSAPIAIALLAAGAVRLAAVAEARSWPWLGPGVVMLLVPSLLATIGDRPIWRLVAIGVVGIAVMIVGALRRLQAPLMIASIVVLVHVVATFLPQIRAAYEFLPWWLWLAGGGIVLIVLAARYEKRARDLRVLAERVGALR